jgi:hypothetical protein
VLDLADRWAALWEEDPAQMVEEVYSPDVVVQHAGRGERGRVSGRQALHQAERELKEMIPDHRNEIIRVVENADGSAVVESVIVGTGGGDDGPQSCPACVWWRMDDQGLVVEEIAFYEWGKRRPYSDQARSAIVGGNGRARPSAWYRSMSERLARLWSTDPAAMVSRLYAEDTVVERLGEGAEAILRGRDSLLAAELSLLELLPQPQRRMDVLDVKSDRDVMAVRFTIRGSWRGTGPMRAGPGSVVLTLDDEDKIVSDRIYWHWSRAREIND